MNADLRTAGSLATRVTLIAAACAALAAGQAHAAATITINNVNAPGVGFNDATAAVPVGGNSGTTLGQQRLIAFQRAADIWGATLDSSVTIIINAQFTALTCTATSAVLGSAGATSSQANFPGAPLTNTWYPIALRNKLAGTEANPGVGQISANFNSNLGLNANCLPGSQFYLGLDNNVPSGQINLIVTLLHEFGHGLGFSVGPTNASTGARATASGVPYPSVWERNMFDNALNLSWFDMTDAQRAASSISVDKLVWTGTNVVSNVPNVLRQGVAGTAISGPAAGALAGASFTTQEASFGAALTLPGVTAELMPVVDQADGVTGLACDPLNNLNRLALAGKIAVIDRGTCTFPVKVKNAQDAGAIGVVVVNNQAGLPPMGGSDPTITIPAVGIGQADGNALKTVLRNRARTRSGVFARLGLFGTQYAGADTLGRIKLYAPNPFVSGSSVSHYDTSATRNQLMEPSINVDLLQSVKPPEDLTFPLLKDIGW
jgi:hypothetical protein